MPTRSDARFRRTAAALPALALALGVVPAGCAAGDSTRLGPVVRDSAGIEIVENRAPAWDDDDRWTISPAPQLQIGVLDGEAAYQLDGVRGAVRLRDGRIVIANGGSSELRIYDPSGRHIRTVGGEGKGPGEFDGLIWVGTLPGDTIVAWDWSAKRFSVFDPAGDFVRSASIGTGGAFPQILGVFTDGSFVINHGFTPVFADGTHVGRDTITLLRISGDGSAADTLGRVPGEERYSMTGGSGENRWATMGLRPFGRSASISIHGDRIYIGVNDTYEIAVRDAAGALLRLVRKPHEPVPVTNADIARIRERRLANARSDNARREAERLLAEVPFPSFRPAFGDLRVDPDGFIWVQDYRIDPDDPSIWSIFDPDGRFLGTLEVPAGNRLLAVYRDAILTTWRDELDVEYVRLYRLDRSRRG